MCTLSMNNESRKNRRKWTIADSTFDSFLDSRSTVRGEAVATSACWRGNCEQDRNAAARGRDAHLRAQAVNQFGRATAPAKSRSSIQLADEVIVLKRMEEEEKPRDSRKVPILFLNRARKKSCVQKIGRAEDRQKRRDYKLPSVPCCARASAATSSMKMS